jgi:hypothetical protein
MKACRDMKNSQISTPLNTPDGDPTGYADTIGGMALRLRTEVYGCMLACMGPAGQEA